MNMKENALMDKSIDFGERIVKLHRYLGQTRHESVLSKRILRSGTSIGANIHEAQYGNIKAGFIAKLHIALKEAAETEYWLRLMENRIVLMKAGRLWFSGDSLSRRCWSCLHLGQKG